MKALNQTKKQKNLNDLPKAEGGFHFISPITNKNKECYL